MLRLYNTLTHKVEDFKPLHTDWVGFYSCGPTVYDFAHIGHARTYIFADILQRVLEFNGYKVKRVMNITDVGHLTSDADEGEDKMEKGAAREGKTVWEIAKFYTDDFFVTLQKLNIKKPEKITFATQYISSMIRIIELLEKKGFTYNVPGDGIYFDTSKFPKYGELTGHTFQELQGTLKAGARIEMIKGKKNVTDFALWKFSPSGINRQMEWDSPWGRGFPGWHIECSAMCIETLGETIDIHTGGVDHIPIHHTNEIAQSESATDKKFVNYWLHGEHLLVNGEKMSKSKGNFFRLQDIEDKSIVPIVLRYLFLTANYRVQMNFTWKSVESAHNAYNALIESILNIKNSIYSGERTSLSEEKLEKVLSFKSRYTEAINDDLNIPKALGILWEVVKSNIPSSDKYDLVLLFDEVFGLELDKLKVKSEKLKVPDEIKRLIEKRIHLRKEKKFIKADDVRVQIEKKGYLLKDSPAGPQLSLKK